MKGKNSDCNSYNFEITRSQVLGEYANSFYTLHIFLLCIYIYIYIILYILYIMYIKNIYDIYIKYIIYIVNLIVDLKSY